MTTHMVFVFVDNSETQVSLPIKPRVSQTARRATMPNVTLYTFHLPESGFSVVNAMNQVSARVNADDVVSLRFVLHITEKPAFVGSIKKMANMQISYELQDKPGKYGEMLLSMQLVVGDMLRESNSSLLSRIEVEVEHGM